MKKALCIVSVLVILFAFAACKPEPAPGPEPGPTPTEDPLVGVWVNIDENPMMIVTTTLTLKKDGTGSIYYDYRPVEDGGDAPEPQELEFTWFDINGFMALLYDTSHYTPKYPGGTDPAKWEYIGTENKDLLVINYVKGEYVITSRIADCEVSEDGSVFTKIIEDKLFNQTYTFVYTFDRTDGIMTEEQTCEYNDTGAVDYRALNWIMDETGAGENYRYRICNDKLGVDLKRDPYILLDDGKKLVYRDEVFIKQM